jgi:hypothetical protein
MSYCHLPILLPSQNLTLNPQAFSKVAAKNITQTQAWIKGPQKNTKINFFFYYFTPFKKIHWINIEIDFIRINYPHPTAKSN